MLTKGVLPYIIQKVPTLNPLGTLHLMLFMTGSKKLHTKVLSHIFLIRHIVFKNMWRCLPSSKIIVNDEHKALSCMWLQDHSFQSVCLCMPLMSVFSNKQNYMYSVIGHSREFSWTVNLDMVYFFGQHCNELFFWFSHGQMGEDWYILTVVLTVIYNSNCTDYT